MAVTVMLKGGILYTSTNAVSIEPGFWLPHPDSSLESAPGPAHVLKNGVGNVIGAIMPDELIGYVIEPEPEVSTRSSRSSRTRRTNS